MHLIKCYTVFIYFSLDVEMSRATKISTFPAASLPYHSCRRDMMGAFLAASLSGFCWSSFHIFASMGSTLIFLSSSMKAAVRASCYTFESSLARNLFSSMSALEAIWSSLMVFLRRWTSNLLESAVGRLSLVVFRSSASQVV